MEEILAYLNKKNVIEQDIYYQVTPNIFIANMMTAVKDVNIEDNKVGLILCCGEQLNIKKKNCEVESIFGTAKQDMFSDSYACIREALLHGQRVCICGPARGEVATHYYLYRLLRCLDKINAPPLNGVIKWLHEAYPALRLDKASYHVLENIEKYILTMKKNCDNM